MAANSVQQIIRNPERWERHFYQLEDVDELKPPQSAESIIVMAEALTGIDCAPCSLC